MSEKKYSVGIYARLSVDSHDAKNASIETQIEIAKSYIRNHKELVFTKCYTDLGKSGMNFEREGFKHLLEDVKRGEINCIIVKDFSRFGRDYLETGNYIQKIFPFLGVRFIAVTDSFDSAFAGNDELGMNLKNLMNEMYARDISVKVKSVKMAMKEQGSYIGGVPPYGYRAVLSRGKRILCREEKAACIVKKIYDFYDAGKSMQEIIQWLYTKEVHRPTEYHRYGHVYRQADELLKRWSLGTVRMLLSSEIYGKGREACIEEEQFFRVRERRKARTQNSSGKNILAGRIFCAECTGRMQKIKKQTYSCKNGCKVCIAHPELTELLKAELEKEMTRQKEQAQKKLFAEIKYRNQKGSEWYWKYKNGMLSKEVFFKRKKEEERYIQELKRKTLYAGGMDEKSINAMDFKIYVSGDKKIKLVFDLTIV